jgi:hypothetical protein
MKAIRFGIMLLLAMLIVTSCEEKKNKAQQEDGWEDNVNYILHDSTIYGVCTDGSSMNTLQILTDNGDTLTINTTYAEETMNVLGGYTSGDRMAVILREDRSQALCVTNISMLLGDWVMLDPMDGSSYVGIRIKDGGIAESINQSTIIYKTWRMFNGKLEVVSVREDGGDFEDTEIFTISKLTGDSLVIRDAEQVYDYTRPGLGEDYGDVDINLEDSNPLDDVI